MPDMMRHRHGELLPLVGIMRGTKLTTHAHLHAITSEYLLILYLCFFRVTIQVALNSFLDIVFWYAVNGPSVNLVMSRRARRSQ